MAWDHTQTELHKLGFNGWREGYEGIRSPEKSPPQSG
jgi:hypothetical protein